MNEIRGCLLKVLVAEYPQLMKDSQFREDLYECNTTDGNQPEDAFDIRFPHKSWQGDKWFNSL